MCTIMDFSFLKNTFSRLCKSKPRRVFAQSTYWKRSVIRNIRDQIKVDRTKRQGTLKTDTVNFLSNATAIKYSDNVKRHASCLQTHGYNMSLRHIAHLRISHCTVNSGADESLRQEYSLIKSSLTES
jgi:hypothetical protein